ncbi:MAG: YcxB family protein [Acidobacteriota bacterium]
MHRLVWDDAYIAEAQRVMLAQNRSFRLMYQTWWVWWIPRFVVLAVIGWLIVAGVKVGLSVYGYFIGFLFLHPFGEYWAHRSLARARARNRNRGSTTTVTMSDEGIDIVGALGSSKLKWKAPRSISVKPDGILLMHSNLTGLWLPGAALVEGTPDDVRQLLTAHRERD